MSGTVKNPALNYVRLTIDGDNGMRSTVQNVYALLPQIVFLVGAEGSEITYLNNRVTDILGFQQTEVDTWAALSGHFVGVPRAEAPAAMLEKLHALGDNETCTVTACLKSKTGQNKYLKITGCIDQLGKKGQPEIFLCIAEDVTQAVANVQATDNALVSEPEALLKFGTWGWDAATHEIKLSDGIFTLIGCARENAELNMPFLLRFISQEDIASLAAKAQEAIAGKKDFEHTYSITTAAGQQKTICSNGKAILSPTGELVRLIGTSRDVTEQVTTYRELSHYKQLMLEQEEFLESGSWEVSLETGKITWSDGMFRLFEYKAENGPLPEPTNAFYFSHFSPEDIEKNTADWQAFLQGDGNYVHEETIIANNGVKKTLETYGIKVKGSNGQPEKVMGASKDISRLKGYERQLEKKLQELERSNRDLEEFAYVASHDLQEPLRKISTFGERLKVKFEHTLGDEGKNYINRMLSATANMRMLIENLLNFSRLTPKGFEFADADLNVLLDETLTEIELQVDESHATVHRQNLPVLQVIPSQIKQLFNNIILNALKFKNANVPPVIDIACSPLTQQEAESRYLQKDITYYAITVRDNGIGFEQEYAEKIFQIFQRLHGKSEYPGAGIGLAICKKIVENHHGKLFAEGLPGQGAAFTVILPGSTN